ncbi:MAG: carboxymuconolactone decarboxylase family protein [Ignavibacteriota bacterium]|jgi:alkylhydroperoxidase/carboxymuconolactone decarboxylase family protein YurZ|nr:carboxymuconolactone decarboxylase family protein [Ignavibacteriales bacterium]MBL1122372.1 carboxymuconolactone decarboxylase [Ignavibacteriota bacterium]MCC7094793.1 carboxymuconolactone decarboxylase family protein [Ignavibacteriaceae bacterium]MCE7855006.1 carboxymuconolactone decarboxylase [Ignavibacteria bacterium CHB3]MEB2295179.1 carboxymuconolactone decarboxylase family protein [Ignavibacteria bacterium]
MSKGKIVKWILFLVLILNGHTMNAQNKTDSLNQQQQSLVIISALTATGDLENLKTELNNALDDKVSINEIKEALAHLYAYCGFPRSLNGLTTLMQVVEKRKKAGKSDVVGREASPISTNKSMLEIGTEVQTKLVGQPVSGGVMEFAPVIDRYLKEHLFGAIFSSDILNHQQRELVTISALASMSGTLGQLQSHIGIGMNTGLTENQFNQTFNLIEKYIGKKQADDARAVLSETIRK